MPDLAESWSWGEDGKELTFKLRHASNGTTEAVSPPAMSNAHRPAAGEGEGTLRVNPRRDWYHNVVDVTTEGDDEAVSI